MTVFTVIYLSSAQSRPCIKLTCTIYNASAERRIVRRHDQTNYLFIAFFINIKKHIVVKLN